MSVNFKSWSVESPKLVKSGELRIISLNDAKCDAEETARNNIANELPNHYASPERIARILKQLGKPKVADYLKTKFPNSLQKRSGELGEVIATEYIQERTDFQVPIKRLRWKDHDEMPMRGDDVLGISFKRGKIHFLKVEVKSENVLSITTINAARKTLHNNSERPTCHALSFVADKLFDEGNAELSDAIDRAQLSENISIKQISHMIFAFTGNKPDDILERDLEDYDGQVDQISVGLRVENHQDFIKCVFEKALEDNAT